MLQTTCHFRFRVENGTASYYLGDQLMMERALGDYEGGYIGLISYKTTAVFNNVYVTSLDKTEEDPSVPSESGSSTPSGEENPSTGAVMGGAGLAPGCPGSRCCMCVCTPTEEGGLYRSIKKKKEKGPTRGLSPCRAFHCSL